MDDLMDGWDGWMDECMFGWMGEWMHDCTNQWIDEWMD